MNPRKPNELIDSVAQKLGVSEKLVEHVVEYYWKAIRKNLVNCEATNVKLHGLGTFRAKPWKLADMIRKYNNIVLKYKSTIEAGDKISFQKFAIMKEAEEKLAQLNRLKDLVQEDENKKLTIKEKRNAEKIKDNLEKPQGDISGTME